MAAQKTEEEFLYWWRLSTQGGGTLPKASHCPRWRTTPRGWQHTARGGSAPQLRWLRATGADLPYRAQASWCACRAYCAPSVARRPTTRIACAQGTTPGPIRFRCDVRGLACLHETWCARRPALCPAWMDLSGRSRTVYCACVGEPLPQAFSCRISPYFPFSSENYF